MSSELVQFCRELRSPRRLTYLLLLLSAVSSTPIAADANLAASLLARPSDTADTSAQLMSDDGRFVVFVSASPHQIIGQIDPNDTLNDVFLFDRVENTLKLISQAHGKPRTTGNSASFEPSISRDGAFIVFGSLATDLVPGTDDNDTQDIFLYDVAQGTLKLLSHAWDDPDTTANGFSQRAILSGDGSTVVFNSSATDLLPDFVNNNDGFVDLFRKALPSGEPTLVSHAFGSANTSGDQGSGFPPPAISFDGSTIAFSSSSTNLVDGSDTNDETDAFLFSFPSGDITLISRNPGSPTTTGNDESTVSGISDDGAWVVFESLADDLTLGTDLPTGGQPDTDVFLFSRASGEVSLISHLPGSPNDAGNHLSEDPQISGDGGRIVFTSNASDLVDGVSDTNDRKDIFAYSRSDGEVTLISHAFGDPSTTANRASTTGQISRLGGFVTFDSDATNLLDLPPVHPFHWPQIYRRSLSDQSLQLISRRAQPPTAFANDWSRSYAVSGDGESVLFRSNASDLARFLSTDRQWALYLHDASAGATQAVSVTDLGLPARTSDNFNGLESFLTRPLSADGRHVVFTSSSTSLVPGQVDQNSARDVFLFDRVTGTTHLISHVPGQPLVTGSGRSDLPVISSDGQAVVFRSSSPELLPSAAGGDESHVFHYDRSTGVLTLVSEVLGTSDDAVDPEISGDGQSVAYVKNGIHHFSVATGVRTFVAGGRYPSLSHDGQDMVFESLGSLVPEDTNSRDDIYHAEMDGGTVNFALVSRTPEGQAGNHHSEWPSISSDGQYAVFHTLASDLVPDDQINTLDVFHADLTEQTLTLVSRRPGQPTSATGGSTRAVISGDGQAVAFSSISTELVDDFIGASINIFHFDLPTGVVTLASHAHDGDTTSGNSLSNAAAISADGQTVTFESEATNLIEGFINGSGFEVSNVYRFDLPGGEVELLSHDLADPLTGADGQSDIPAISADGKIVVYESRAGNLVAGDNHVSGLGHDIYLHGDNLTADLRITAIDPTDPIDPGDEIHYIVDVFNKGPGAAPQPRVHLIPPEGAAILGVTGEDWSCAILLQTLACDYSPLASQTGSSSLFIRVQSSPDVCQPVATVGVSSAALDPMTDNNTVEVATEVTDCGLLFEDSFESGDTSAWSAEVG